MKTYYRLATLKREEIQISADTKNQIFFKMLDFTTTINNHIDIVHSFEKVNTLMSDKPHYITQKLFSTKGKKRFFTGELAIATKENILLFLEKSIKDSDLRSLILAPVFELEPNYVIFIHEDESFFKYIAPISAIK